MTFFLNHSTRYLSMVGHSYLSIHLHIVFYLWMFVRVTIAFTDFPGKLKGSNLPELYIYSVSMIVYLWATTFSSCPIPSTEYGTCQFIHSSLPLEICKGDNGLSRFSWHITQLWQFLWGFCSLQIVVKY